MPQIHGCYICETGIQLTARYSWKYSKGLFLSRLKGRRDEAIESAILSIAGFPWNWATWMLLGSCIEDGEEVCLYLMNGIIIDRH
jgi:hypothetical protein